MVCVDCRECGVLAGAGDGDAGTGSSVAMLTFFQSLNITLDPASIQPAAASPATSSAACSHCSYAGPALQAICRRAALTHTQHSLQAWQILRESLLGFRSDLIILMFIMFNGHKLDR